MNYKLIPTIISLIISLSILINYKLIGYEESSVFGLSSDIISGLAFGITFGISAILLRKLKLLTPSN